MRKITVNLNISLDGVVQAPGRADEDTRGGFPYGGWAGPYFDEVMAGNAARAIASQPGLLFGRRTYEDFYAVWPGQSGNMFTEVLNNAEKYVVSRTLEEPLSWSNSQLLKGEAALTVAALKEGPGKDLAILGSAMLVRSLEQQDLIDEYVLSIHPLVLGSGWRLFPPGSPRRDFQLAESLVTTTGVVIATYRRA